MRMRGQTVFNNSIIKLIFHITIMALLSTTSVQADMEAAKAAYLKGEYSTVIKELMPLAEKGNEDAQYQLGLMYANGKGVPEDQKLAEAWIDKATQKYDPGAQFNVAVMYYEGQGIPKNYTWAAKWFRKSAERGDAQAQFNLGLMYELGQGVPLDLKEAAKWYDQAARQGIKNAQISLANMYRDGKGVAKDEILSYLWYKFAADQGDAESKLEEEKMRKSLPYEKLSKATLLAHEIKANGYESEADMTNSKDAANITIK